MATKTPTTSTKRKAGEGARASRKKAADAVEGAENTNGGNDLRKKELIDTVVLRSGVKKKDAKPVVEAMLAVMGEALAEGREFNLAPLGKLRINKAKDVNGGRVIINRIRQSSAPQKAGTDPLAEPVE